MAKIAVIGQRGLATALATALIQRGLEEIEVVEATDVPALENSRSRPQWPTPLAPEDFQRRLHLTEQSVEIRQHNAVIERARKLKLAQKRIRSAGIR